MLKNIRLFVPVFGLLLATVSVAAAQEAITNVRVLDAGGSPVTARDGSFALPEGAKQATIQFDYNLGGTESVGVTVIALGVPSVANTKSVSGQGTASFEITGDAIYGAVAAGALKGAQAAVAAQGNAGLQKASTMSYLEAIQGPLSSVRTSPAMLKRLKLDSAFDTSVAGLERALSDFDTSVAGVTAAGTEEAKKAKIGDLKAPLLAVQQAATDINDRLGKASGLALPTTGSDSKTPIDVSIRRGGSPAESLQILVGTGSLVPAATITKSSQSLTGDKTATPAPSGAQAQGQPTTAAAGQTSGTAGQAGSGATGGSTGGTQSGAAPVTGAGMANTGALAAGSTPVPGQAVSPADPAAAVSASGDAGLTSDSQAADASGAAQAVATWTPGPDGSAAVAQLADNPSGSGGHTTGTVGDTGPGPNIAIIAVGALVLMGAALWMRRRM